MRDPVPLQNNLGQQVSNSRETTEPPAVSSPEIDSEEERRRRLRRIKLQILKEKERKKFQGQVTYLRMSYPPLTLLMYIKLCIGIYGNYLRIMIYNIPVLFAQMTVTLVLLHVYKSVHYYYKIIIILGYPILIGIFRFIQRIFFSGFL